MNYYSLKIESDAMLKMTASKFESITQTLDYLSFDWCQEPFDAIVTMDEKSEMMCFAENDEGYFGFIC